MLKGLWPKNVQKKDFPMGIYRDKSSDGKQGSKKRVLEQKENA